MTGRWLIREPLPGRFMLVDLYLGDERPVSWAQMCELNTELRRAMVDEGRRQIARDRAAAEARRARP